MPTFLIDRCVAALSYISMGMVGFIWLIISLFTKVKMNKFLQYHIFQSIFISLGFSVLAIFIGFVSNILSFIPLINKLVAQITFLLNMPLIFEYSLIQSIITVFIGYLAITSFLGKYSYIPYISDLIEQNISR